MIGSGSTRTSFRQNHQLSVSVQPKKITTHLVQHLDDQGVLLSYYFKRYSLV